MDVYDCTPLRFDVSSQSGVIPMPMCQGDMIEVLESHPVFSESCFEFLADCIGVVACFY